MLATTLWFVRALYICGTPNLAKLRPSDPNIQTLSGYISPSSYHFTQRSHNSDQVRLLRTPIEGTGNDMSNSRKFVEICRKLHKKGHPDHVSGKGISKNSQKITVFRKNLSSQIFIFHKQKYFLNGFTKIKLLYWWKYSDGWNYSQTHKILPYSVQLTNLTEDRSRLYYWKEPPSRSPILVFQEGMVVGVWNFVCAFRYV